MVNNPSVMGQQAGGHLGGPGVGMGNTGQYENLLAYQNSEQLHLLHQQQHLQLQEHQLQQKLLLIQQQQRMQQQLIVANQQFTYRSQQQQQQALAASASSSSGRPPQTMTSIIDLSGVDSGDDAADSNVFDVAEIRRATGFDEESLMLRPVESAGLLSAYGAPLLPSLKLDSTMHRDYIAAVETVYQGGKRSDSGSRVSEGRDDISTLLTALPPSSTATSSCRSSSGGGKAPSASKPTVENQDPVESEKGPGSDPVSVASEESQAEEKGYAEEAGGGEGKGKGKAVQTSEYWHDESGLTVSTSATPASSASEVAAVADQSNADSHSEESTKPPSSAPQAQAQVTGDTPMDVVAEAVVETVKQAEETAASSSDPLPTAKPREGLVVSTQEAEQEAASTMTDPSVPVRRPSISERPVAASPCAVLRLQQQQQLQVLQMMQPPVIKSFTPAGPNKKEVLYTDIMISIPGGKPPINMSTTSNGYLIWRSTVNPHPGIAGGFLTHFSGELLLGINGRSAKGLSVIEVMDTITRSVENVIVVVRRMFSSEAVLHSWLKSISGPGKGPGKDKGQGQGSSSAAAGPASGLTSTAPSSSSGSSSSAGSSSAASSGTSSATLSQSHLPTLPSPESSPSETAEPITESESEIDSSESYDCSDIAYVGPEYCWNMGLRQAVGAAVIPADDSNVPFVEVRLDAAKIPSSRRPNAASTDVLCGDPESLYQELSRQQPTKGRASNKCRSAPTPAPPVPSISNTESSAPSSSSGPLSCAPSCSSVSLSSPSVPGPSEVPPYQLSTVSTAAAPKKNYAAIRRPVQCFSLLNGQVLQLLCVILFLITILFCPPVLFRTHSLFKS
jgi:hypothetical protein